MYKLCTPAMIYAIFAGISILVALFSKFLVFSIITKALFAVAWTWFLNYLCVKGYKVISWFLVLLPFLMILGIVALAAETVNAASKQVPSLSYYREGYTPSCAGKTGSDLVLCNLGGKRTPNFKEGIDFSACVGLKDAAKKAQCMNRIRHNDEVK